MGYDKNGKPTLIPASQVVVDSLSGKTLKESIDNKELGNNVKNTLSGGETNASPSVAVVKSELDRRPTTQQVNEALGQKADKTAVNNKQEKLVSGQNVKTIGGISILGSGNIPLPFGSGVNITQAVNPSDTANAPSSKAVADYVAAHAGQGDTLIKIFSKDFIYHNSYIKTNNIGGGDVFRVGDIIDAEGLIDSVNDCHVIILKVLPNSIIYVYSPTLAGLCKKAIFFNTENEILSILELEANVKNTLTSPNIECYLVVTLKGTTSYVELPITSMLANTYASLADVRANSEKTKINLPYYVDCPIGRNTDLFLDGIIASPDDIANLPLRISGGKVSYFGGKLTFTPSSVEEQIITFEVFKDNELRFPDVTKKCTIRSVPRNNGNGAVKNICICGDSLVDGSWLAPEAFRLLAEDGDCTINQIGTLTTSKGGNVYKHEGRGGWTWADYLNPAYELTPKSADPTRPDLTGKTNAFLHNGELDFQNYMRENFPSLEGIDYFVIALGTNDVTQGRTLLTDKKMYNIITNVKSFIDALVSVEKGFPNCKIAIGLPAVGAPYFASSGSSASVFEMSIQKLNEAYLYTFDNGKYHPNVTCVCHGAYIYRYGSYPFEDVAINDYVDGTLRKFTNSVHPLDIGYKQWGRGIYGKLRAFIDNKL